jgi:hypothetical protein
MPPAERRRLQESLQRLAVHVRPPAGELVHHLVDLEPHRDGRALAGDDLGVRLSVRVLFSPRVFASLARSLTRASAHSAASQASTGLAEDLARANARQRHQGPQPCHVGTPYDLSKDQHAHISEQAGHLALGREAAPYAPSLDPVRPLLVLPLPPRVRPCLASGGHRTRRSASCTSGFRLPDADRGRAMLARVEADSIRLIERNDDLDCGAFTCLTRDGWRMEVYWERFDRVARGRPLARPVQSTGIAVARLRRSRVRGRVVRSGSAISLIGQIRQTQQRTDGRLLLSNAVPASRGAPLGRLFPHRSGGAELSAARPAFPCRDEPGSVGSPRLIDQATRTRLREP